MIRFDLTLYWLNLIALFDLVWMSFAEYGYWGIINKNKTPDIEAERKKVSSNVSIIQFSFAYLIGALVLVYSAYNEIITWPVAGWTFASFGILHYSGNEDLLYFIYNFIFNIIPEWWWSTREYFSVGKRKLPKELPWLYEIRKIWKIKITPYMLRFFGGEKITFKGLLTSSIAGWLIIIAIHYQIWDYLWSK